jgi:hypothetical protein
MLTSCQGCCNPSMGSRQGHTLDDDGKRSHPRNDRFIICDVANVLDNLRRTNSLFIKGALG